MYYCSIAGKCQTMLWQISGKVWLHIIWKSAWANCFIMIFVPLFHVNTGHPDKFAMIYDSIILDHMAQTPPCTTRTISEVFRQSGYGLVLRKHSPYTAMFDSAILELREDGIIDTLTQKWISGPCSGSSNIELCIIWVFSVPSLLLFAAGKYTIVYRL